MSKELGEIIIRKVPRLLRKALKRKANEDDKPMNTLILEVLGNSVPGWGEEKKPAEERK